MQAILIGGGGHSCVLRDAIIQANQNVLLGYVDSRVDGPLADVGVPWLGDETDLLASPDTFFTDPEIAVFIGIGDNSIREKVMAKFAAQTFNFRFPALIHPRATVCADAHIGDGAQVLAGAVIGAGADIGQGVLVNVNAVVDHHSRVGGFASLAQNSATGGSVRIGERTAVGVGATIRHGRSVAEDCVVAGGSHVDSDVAPCTIVSGVPATVTGSRSRGEKYL